MMKLFRLFRRKRRKACPSYLILIGNGAVGVFSDGTVAGHSFDFFVLRSKAPSNIFSGQSVTLLCDGKPIREYQP